MTYNINNIMTAVTLLTKYVAVNEVNKAVIFQQVVLYWSSRQKDPSLCFQINQGLICLILRVLQSMSLHADKHCRYTAPALTDDRCNTTNT